MLQTLCEIMNANSQKLQTRFLHLSTALYLVVFALLFNDAEATAAEPKPGQELKIDFSIESKQVPITFRFCPPGQIVPGEPKQDNKPGGASNGNPMLGGPKQISAFHLSETEITVAQFAQVVGSDRFRRLSDRAAKMKGAKEDVALLDAGNDKSPIFMVDPFDAIFFCKMLNESQLGGAGEGRSEIERWDFRLPSHVEWQYACRAVSDADGITKYPHFHSWADYDALNKNDRAKCLEEWKEIGRQEAEFVGNQFQIAELITNRYSTTNSKPLEILSVFLEQGIGSKRDFSKSTTAPVGNIKSTGPNAWGFYDMHDNVREWTIGIEDKGELQRLWKDLVNQSEISESVRNRKILFLAGGAAIDAMAGGTDAAWNAFSIWGGRPMDVKSGTPEYFSLSDDHDGEKTFDWAPGLRILLERVLADDWLLAVRRKTILLNDKPVQAKEAIDEYKNVVNEVVAESLQNEKKAVLDFYAGLAQYRLGNIAEAATIIDSQKASLVPAKKKKIDLSTLNILSTSPTSNQSSSGVDAERSEDAIYFEYLANLIKQDEIQN
jgi:formylglycine-generating enzyme required for sulfatase activity